MATFAAENSGANMMLLFSWVDGGTPIDVINIDNDLGRADVEQEELFSGSVLVRYTDDPTTDFIADGTIPNGGTFAGAELRFATEGGAFHLTGTLSGVTTTDNFKDIVTEDAYLILDGDDTLNGGTGTDILFGGYGGSDTYVGGGGGDTFVVATATTPVAISGTAGLTDTITVVPNLNGQGILNLRETGDIVDAHRSDRRAPIHPGEEQHHVGAGILGCENGHAKSP